MRQVILTCIAHYMPGWKFGGPIRSVANLVEHLSDEYLFRILTSNHDYGDTAEYLDIEADCWLKVGKAEVFYASSKRRTLKGLVTTLRETHHDVLYLNSLFHRDSTVIPLVARRLGMVPRQPCVLAPRGECATAALAIKATKKRSFLAAARLSGLYSGLRMQASSEFEAADILRTLGCNSGEAIMVAADLPGSLPVEQFRPLHEAGDDRPLRLVLIARLSRMKNVEFALKVLEDVQVPVTFDIWGTIEDQAYWSNCEAMISKMPPNVRVSYCGPAQPADVSAILGRYDLMFMPTRGENFGHSIAEALAVGTPALISDRTPWRNLNPSDAGWDLSIEAGCEAFRTALLEADKMCKSDSVSWRKRVRNFASRTLLNTDTLDANRHLFTFSECR